MDIAYLILAHQEPERVVRLVHRLNQPGSSFVIHYDKNGLDADYAVLERSFQSHSNVFFASRVACYWGDYSLVEAALSCVTKLFERRVNFDYAMLLSGQDYPVKSNDEIHKFLQANLGMEFIQLWELPHDDWGPMRGWDRVDYVHWNHFPKESKIRKLLLQVTRVTRKLKLWRRERPPGIQFYGGSQWWALSRGTLKSLLAFIEQKPRLAAFFRKVNIPDEMFFQTLLMNGILQPHQVYPHSTRYMVWHTTATNEHPKVLEESDLEAALASGMLFARKFDTHQHPRLLDLLDQRLDSNPIEYSFMADSDN